MGYPSIGWRRKSKDRNAKERLALRLDLQSESLLIVDGAAVECGAAGDFTADTTQDWNGGQKYGPLQIVPGKITIGWGGTGASWHAVHDARSETTFREVDVIGNYANLQGSACVSGTSWLWGTRVNAWTDAGTNWQISHNLNDAFYSPRGKWQDFYGLPFPAFTGTLTLFSSGMGMGIESNDHLGWFKDDDFDITVRYGFQTAAIPTPTSVYLGIASSASHGVYVIMGRMGGNYFSAFDSIGKLNFWNLPSGSYCYSGFKQQGTLRLVRTGGTVFVGLYKTGASWVCMGTGIIANGNAGTIQVYPYLYLEHDNTSPWVGTCYLNSFATGQTVGTWVKRISTGGVKMDWTKLKYNATRRALTGLTFYLSTNGGTHYGTFATVGGGSTIYTLNLSNLAQSDNVTMLVKLSHQLTTAWQYNELNWVELSGTQSERVKFSYRLSNTAGTWGAWSSDIVTFPHELNEVARYMEPCLWLGRADGTRPDVDKLIIRGQGLRQVDAVVDWGQAEQNYEPEMAHSEIPSYTVTLNNADRWFSTEVVGKERIIGRTATLYHGFDGLSLGDWISVFRGAINSVEVNPETAVIEVLSE